MAAARIWWPRRIMGTMISAGSGAHRARLGTMQIRLRFTTRWILIVVLAAGLSLTAWNVLIRPSQIEQAARSALVRAGARVLTERGSGGVFARKESVVAVDLRECREPRRLLTRLPHLRNLRVIALPGESMTMSDFETIDGAKSIERVFLDSPSEEVKELLRNNWGFIVIPTYNSLLYHVNDNGRTFEWVDADLSHRTISPSIRLFLGPMYGFDHGIDRVVVYHTNQRVASLIQCPGIKQLHIVPQAMADARWLAELRGPRSLESFSAYQNVVSDESLRYLSTCPSLRSVEVYHTQITGKGLLQLRQLTAIEELNLAYCQLDDHGLSSIGTYPKLTHLDLDGAKIHDRSLPFIAKQKALERLYLTNTMVSDLDGLTDLVKLHELRISRTPIADLSAVASMPNLETLKASQTKVDDNGCRALAKLKALRRLDLSGTAISDVTLHTISGLHGLQDLDVAKTAITDDGIESLAALQDLQFLELTGTQITEERIEAFQAAHPNLTILK
jgi:Leucine-rich repeat (LRR) protein